MATAIFTNLLEKKKSLKNWHPDQVEDLVAGKKAAGCAKISPSVSKHLANKVNNFF